MARTMHGRGVMRHIRDVMVVASAHNSSFPSFLAIISPIHFNSYRRLHLVPPKSCHGSQVTSISLPPIPPYLRPNLLSSHISPLGLNISSASISTSPIAFKIRSKVDGEDLSKAKKKEFVSPVIKLIGTDGNVSKMGLNQAEKMAKRRDLKLVKVEDPNLTKGSKDVYRLLTGKEFLEEQMKLKRTKKKSAVGTKDEKTLAVGGNINQHDLFIKLQSVIKWLSRGHQVKVSIAAKRSTKEDVEKVFSTIEEEIKKHKGRIMQHHEKMNDIRFYIVPPAGKEEDKEIAQEDHQASDNESKSDEAK